MVPGMIGTLQATETVKIILGMEEDQLLCKRMLFYDGLNVKFRMIKMRERNPKCEVCGENPTLTDV